MKRALIRSTLFNILFITGTLVCCILFLPTLLLPRKWHLGIANTTWHYMILILEHTVLGLKYEVRGLEHLPPRGTPFLVAAKHMSAYETLKLRLLFDDPAIILKKELLSIPLWGWYLKKSGVIAIDRSTPESAIKSIDDGARRMKAAERPVVIFPQGTRTAPKEDTHQKPYKAGIARIQAATDLPILPMATNSGLFWPAKGWLKTPGTIVFKFLPPLPPGMDRKALMKTLEEQLEYESAALMNEARAEHLTNPPDNKKAFLKTAAFLVLAFGIYTFLWHFYARAATDGYEDFLRDISNAVERPETPVVSGFPGPVTLSVASQTLSTREGSVRYENLRMRGWPIPLLPVRFEAGPVTIKSYKWADPLTLDQLKAHLMILGNTVKILDSKIDKGRFRAGAEGTLGLEQEPVPEIDITVSMENHIEFLEDLVALKILKRQTAMLMGAGFNAFADENGVVRVPLTQRNQTLFAGPIPVVSLPALHRPARGNRPAPGQ